jgi:hypothetical protein
MAHRPPPKPPEPPVEEPVNTAPRSRAADNIPAQTVARIPDPAVKVAEAIKQLRWYAAEAIEEGADPEAVAEHFNMMSGEAYDA